MILVTGASGFVGGNLVRALLAQGRSVRVLVHRDRRALVGLDVETMSSDLTDPASVNQALRGAEVVYHLASTISISMGNWDELERVNVMGTLGALMLVGGLIGAIVIPALSDKQRKRQRYLLLGFILAILGLVGLTYATSALLFASAFELGFFLVSTLPVGMQYAAEITYPTPEGTSNGLVQLCGQGAVVFVYIMEALRAPDGSFTTSLLLSIGLLVVSVGVITQSKDPVSASK